MSILLAAILSLAALAPASAAPAPAPAANAFAPASSDAASMVWVEADPRACHTNPWDHNPGIGGTLGFFQEHGVQVYDNATISFDQLYDQPVAVCQACTCPAGFTLYLLVNEKDLPILAPLGFKVSAINPYDASTYVGSRHMVAPAVPAPPPRVARKPAARAARRPARRGRVTKKKAKRRRRTSP